MTLDTITLANLRDRRSPGGSVLGRMLRDLPAVIGALLLLVALGVALLGPLFAPYGYDEYVASPFAPPSAELLFGADDKGRDVLSRVLYGGWTVVWMSVTAAAMGTVIGAAIGLAAGYTRGWFDELLMRTTDVALAIPTIVFVLLVVSVFGRDPWLLVILIGISHAPQVARVIRGATLDVREREFVEAARALRSGPLQTIALQIAPNVSVTILVEFGLRIVWSIAALASLSVLGQGLMSPTADWGLMINENRPALSYQPWGVIVPLVMIIVFALGANLVTEGVGRALTRSGVSS